MTYNEEIYYQGWRFFLFDTTAPEMLYTNSCSLRTLQRQRAGGERGAVKLALLRPRSGGERAPVKLGALCPHSGRGARDDFGSAYPYELELRR